MYTTRVGGCSLQTKLRLDGALLSEAPATDQLTVRACNGAAACTEHAPPQLLTRVTARPRRGEAWLVTHDGFLNDPTRATLGWSGFDDASEPVSGRAALMWGYDSLAYKMVPFIASEVTPSNN